MHIAESRAWFDEYNYRDSLQARAIEGIGNCRGIDLSDKKESDNITSSTRKDLEKRLYKKEITNNNCLQNLKLQNSPKV
ncbi:hypothetical protein ACROYT_G017290 [Oculina patagonica]